MQEDAGGCRRKQEDAASKQGYATCGIRSPSCAIDFRGFKTARQTHAPFGAPIAAEGETAEHKCLPVRPHSTSPLGTSHLFHMTTA